jgi:hypothetical protein
MQCCLLLQGKIMARIMLSEKDLKLAWDRLKLDRPNRCFYTPPFIFSWIKPNLRTWLSTISRSLNGGYSPQDCHTCYTPKGGWLVRPGAVLNLEDEIVYNAILGKEYSKIYNHLKWAQGGPDIAYQLQGGKNNKEWIKSGFLIWQAWRKKSLQRLRGGVSQVVFTDIAGFYENIDLSILRSDLNSIGFNRHLLDLLMACLNRWSRPKGRGIPQGYSASDILAKIYLTHTDIALRDAGFKHLRYVDDFRIFCKNKLEAKQAISFLTDLLKSRGLSLQSAKTRIVAKAEAIEEIDGITPVIEEIQNVLRKELAEIGGYSSYATIGYLDAVLESNPEAPAPEVLERAFKENFFEIKEDIDKTLFHYLLTRLGKIESKIAVDYCLDLLRHHPEETEAILRYFTNIDINKTEISRIIQYCASKNSIYDYQLYQIVKWFYERQSYPKKLLRLCREWYLNKNRASWLRSYCLAIIGEAGTPSDLEILENAYGSASNELEKAEIIVALKRMELGRRNSFYGRVKKDGDLIAWAVQNVMSNAG